MTNSDHPDPAQPLLDDYMCTLDLLPGWLNVNLESESKEEAQQLAQELSGSFNLLELRISTRELVRRLAKLALAAKERRTSYAAVYFTDQGENIANIDISVFGEDGECPTPEDITPLLLKHKKTKPVGEPDVRYLTHPLGPAVRVHSRFAQKGVSGFLQPITEMVQCAVCPENTHDVVTVSAWWQTIALSDELTTMADEMTNTLRLVPCDAQGNVIEEGRKA